MSRSAHRSGSAIQTDREVQTQKNVCRPLYCILEHSDSRFESIRFDSLSESIRIYSVSQKIGTSDSIVLVVEWRLSAKPPIDGLPQLTDTTVTITIHTSAHHHLSLISVISQGADSQWHFDITF